MARGPAKTSRAAARARARSVRPSRRGSGPWFWAIAAVVVVGVVLVVVSRSEESSEAASPVIGDHWHAALGVNVCGTWLDAPPEFEDASGIHSHGDGLIHLHPYQADAQGRNANVGRFLRGGGWEASEDSLVLWDGSEWEDGDRCDGEPGRVVWKAAPLEDWKRGDVPVRTGDPADFAPKNGDIVAIGFLPEGVELEEPPTARVSLAGVLGADAVFGGDEPATTTTAPATSTTAAP